MENSTVLMCALKEDMITTQISMVEYYDSFKEWMESYRNGKVNKK